MFLSRLYVCLIAVGIMSFSANASLKISNGGENLLLPDRQLKKASNQVKKRKIKKQIKLVRKQTRKKEQRRSKKAACGLRNRQGYFYHPSDKKVALKKVTSRQKRALRLLKSRGHRLRRRPGRPSCYRPPSRPGWRCTYYIEYCQ